MKKILFALLLIASVACTKVIDIDLNVSDPQLVVNGNITDSSGPYIIKLTRSINYSQSNLYPPVLGATVVIIDETAETVDTLLDQNNGSYLTKNIVGTVGHSYQLYIKSNGKEYYAKSTMPLKVLMDSLTFNTIDGFGQSTTNPVPNFQDPVAIYNAYRFLQWVNGKPNKDLFVFDDRLSDGRYISRQLFNDSTYIRSGDSVTIEMRNIDKNVFEYFKQLSGQDPTNGQPTSPANPTSNISNKALGYFSAHTVQRVTKLFKKK